jgi:hypothetical protein
MAPPNAARCRRPEVIGFGNGLVAAFGSRLPSHTETRQPVPGVSDLVKPWAPEDLVEDWHSCADRIHKLLEGKISFAVDHTHEVTGTRAIGAQRCANLSQFEMPEQYFPEDLFSSEKSHDR